MSITNLNTLLNIIIKLPQFMTIVTRKKITIMIIMDMNTTMRAMSLDIHSNTITRLLQFTIITMRRNATSTNSIRYMSLNTMKRTSNHIMARTSSVTLDTRLIIINQSPTSNISMTIANGMNVIMSFFTGQVRTMLKRKTNIVSSVSIHSNRSKYHYIKLTDIMSRITTNTGALISSTGSLTGIIMLTSTMSTNCHSLMITRELRDRLQRCHFQSSNSSQ